MKSGFGGAVGASRVDILAGLLAESGVTAALAVALGAAAAASLLAVARTLATGVAFGVRPLLLSGATIVFTTLLVAGLSPLRFLRARYMRDQEQGVVPLGFPAFQLAISLMLVMGSALLIGKARDQATAETGARPNGIVVQFDSGLTEHSDRSAVYARLLERLRRTGTRDEVSLTAPGGLLGLGTIDNVTTHCGQCVSGGIFVPYHHTQAVHLFVSPDSFAARGAKLVAGRALTDADTWGGKRVAVVNRHLALRHFESGDAVGREMWLGSDLRREPYEVVGIVEDSGSDVLGGALQPRKAVYLSVLQLPPREADLLIRASEPVDSAAILATHSRHDRCRCHPLRHRGDRLRRRAAGATLLVRWMVRAGGTGGADHGSRRDFQHRPPLGRLPRNRVVAAAGGWCQSNPHCRLRPDPCPGDRGRRYRAGAFAFFVVLRGALNAVVRDLPVWNSAVLVVSAMLFGGIALLAAAIPTVSLLRRPPIAGLR